MLKRLINDLGLNQQTLGRRKYFSSSISVMILSWVGFFFAFIILDWSDHMQMLVLKYISAILGFLLVIMFFVSYIYILPALSVRRLRDIDLNIPKVQSWFLVYIGFGFLHIFYYLYLILRKRIVRTNSSQPV